MFRIAICSFSGALGIASVPSLLFLIYVQINIVAIGIFTSQVALRTSRLFYSIVAQSTFIRSKWSETTSCIRVQIIHGGNVASGVNLVSVMQQDVIYFGMGTGALEIWHFFLCALDHLIFVPVTRHQQDSGEHQHKRD